MAIQITRMENGQIANEQQYDAIALSLGVPALYGFAINRFT
jgi:hypothetical protein